MTDLLFDGLTGLVKTPGLSIKMLASKEDFKGASLLEGICVMNKLEVGGLGFMSYIKSRLGR